VESQDLRPYIATIHHRNVSAVALGVTRLGLVYPTRVGTPIDLCHLREYLNTRCDAADVRHIRFHDLRHSCATLLLEQGVEHVTIKELLGHAHIGVTADIYAHVRLRLQHDAVNRLSAALRTDDEDQPPTPRP